MLIDVHLHTIPAAWSGNATPLNLVTLAEKPAEIPYVSDWRDRPAKEPTVANRSPL